MMNRDDIVEKAARALAVDTYGRLDAWDSYVMAETTRAICRRRVRVVLKSVDELPIGTRDYDNMIETAARAFVADMYGIPDAWDSYATAETTRAMYRRRVRVILGSAGITKAARALPVAERCPRATGATLAAAGVELPPEPEPLPIPEGHVTIDLSGVAVEDIRRMVWHFNPSTAEPPSCLEEDVLNTLARAELARRGEPV